MSLERWLLAFFFKVFWFVKWAKTHDFPAIGKTKADKNAKSFPQSENSIGWKRFGSVISLHLAYRRKSVCFSSFYEAKHLFFRKKNAQNQRVKLISSKWVKLLLYNFGLFQQIFENLKLDLAKEERILDFEDRIWRLKFGKTQFWSGILKNQYQSFYFWKASFHFFGVW